MLPLYQVHVPPGVGEGLQPVWRSGQLASGRHAGRFEELLRAYVGNRRTIATGDASTSLSLCLSMAGVRPGDEVLASPMACLATNEPVLNLFARVRWCDVRPDTGNLDPEDLVRRITPLTKAILVFHWAGNPADLGAIYRIARKHDLRVVEDASESLGAMYGGQKIGNTGSDFTVFSFYANRHLTTIEGGAVTFANEADYERGRWLKRYGIHQPSFRDEWGEIDRRSDIPEAGWNTAMHEIAAAVGVLQMQHLPAIVARHQANGDYYDEALAGVPGITLLSRLPNSRSAHWVYTFLAEDRDGLLRRLKEEGIQASKVHLRNDVYSCFGPPQGDLPGVDAFQAHTLSIPCGWWIDGDQRTRISETIRLGW
jgi:perosamine synthetase